MMVAPFPASLSSSSNQFWGPLLLNLVKVQPIWVEIHNLWSKASSHLAPDAKQALCTKHITVWGYQRSHYQEQEKDSCVLCLVEPVAQTLSAGFCEQPD